MALEDGYGGHLPEQKSWWSVQDVRNVCTHLADRRIAVSLTQWLKTRITKSEMQKKPTGVFVQQDTGPVQYCLYLNIMPNFSSQIYSAKYGCALDPMAHYLQVNMVITDVWGSMPNVAPLTSWHASLCFPFSLSALSTYSPFSFYLFQSRMWKEKDQPWGQRRWQQCELAMKENLILLHSCLKNRISQPGKVFHHCLVTELQTPGAHLLTFSGAQMYRSPPVEYHWSRERNSCAVLEGNLCKFGGLRQVKEGKKLPGLKSSGRNATTSE